MPPSTTIATSGSRIDSRPTTFVATVRMATVAKMISPPIVGVPALTWCVSGPSSLIALPIPRCRNMASSGRPIASAITNAIPAVASEKVVMARAPRPPRPSPGAAPGRAA